MILFGFGIVGCIPACNDSATVLQSSDAGDGSVIDASMDVDSGAPMNNGVIQVSSTHSPNENPPQESTAIFAGFTLDTKSACPPETVVDGCSILDCVPPLSVAESRVTGGTLLVTGGKQNLTLVPSKQADYSPSTLSTALWDGGEALHLVGAGDVAPPVDLTLIAPAFVTVETPVWPTGAAKLVISRSKPFDVAWTGGGAGKVQVAFTSTFATAGFQLIACSFVAAPGVATISAPVLGKIASSATATQISIVSRSTVTKTSGSWTMTFTAEAKANTPTGLAGAPVDLQ